jgi:hypothetical protein
MPVYQYMPVCARTYAHAHIHTHTRRHCTQPGVNLLIGVPVPRDLSAQKSPCLQAPILIILWVEQFCHAKCGLLYETLNMYLITTHTRNYGLDMSLSPNVQFHVNMPHTRTHARAHIYIHVRRHASN